MTTGRRAIGHQFVIRTTAAFSFLVAGQRADVFLFAKPFHARRIRDFIQYVRRSEESSCDISSLIISGEGETSYVPGTK